jgi:hypothetical protein
VYVFCLPLSTRTVIVSFFGSTIQYSGMPALAYSSRFFVMSCGRFFSLTTSMTRSAFSQVRIQLQVFFLAPIALCRKKAGDLPREFRLGR